MTSISLSDFYDCKEQKFNEILYEKVSLYFNLIQAQIEVFELIKK